VSTTKKVTVYFNDQKGEGTWNNIDNAKTAGTSSYMSSGSSHALNGLQLFIFKWTADYLKNYVPSDATITQIYCYLSGRIKTAVGSTQRGNLQWFEPKIRTGQAYSYSDLSTNTMWSSDGTYTLGGGSFDGGALGLSLTEAQSTAVKNNGFSYGGYFSNSSAWYNYFWIAYCYASITYTQPSYYALTVNASTGGTVTGGGTYAENTAVTIKASPNTGYKFTKWSDGNTSATRSVTVTSAATYTAYFEKLTHTVTATAGTGGTVSGGGTYEYGASVTLTATPSEGYKFVQWSDGNTNATRTFTVTGNVTLTASFSTTNLNNIYVGTKQTSGVYIGTTKVKAVYVGTIKIYE
jgi:hypothetical protein